MQQWVKGRSIYFISSIIVFLEGPERDKEVILNPLMPESTFVGIYLIFSFRKQMLQAANTDRCSEVSTISFTNYASKGQLKLICGFLFFAPWPLASALLMPMNSLV